jgi:integrase
MALYKRPRTTHWHYDVTVNGKRYRGSTRCDSKMAAKAFEARLLVSIQEKGYAPKPQRRSETLLAYMPRFQAWVEDSQQLRLKSKRYYIGGLGILGRSPLAHVPLGAIHEDMIDTTEFTTLHGEPASPHLSNQALSTLRRLLNKAKRWGDLAEAPLVGLRECDGRSAIITPEIERKILASLQKPVNHPVVRASRETVVDVFLLMHDAGMRTGEAVAARVENIDWLGHRLFNPGGKSKRAKRWVPLSDRLIARLKFRCHGRSEGWVFPSSKSATGHLCAPQGVFRKACREAGVPDHILLYTGRHTFGTMGVRETGNVFAVSDAMGHQDIKSMRPYQHHDTDVLRGVINQRLESRHTLRHTALPIH